MTTSTNMVLLWVCDYYFYFDLKKNIKEYGGGGDGRPYIPKTFTSTIIYLKIHI